MRNLKERLKKIEEEKIEIKATRRTKSLIMQVQCQVISRFQAITEVGIQEVTVELDEKVQSFPQKGESHDYL